MTAITTAVRLLREAATELKKSHTLNGDWGNEHDALTAYNAHIAAAADLERIAPQCLAQIQEPAAVAGPAWSKTRDSLAMLMLGLASNPNLSLDVACIALDAATESGMPLACLRGAPAAPALEAPAAPIQHQGMTIAGNGASELGKLMRAQRDCRMGVYPDGNPNAGTRADLLAAAPQAPAAPVALPWRTGIPQWTDDNSVRVIAVTAHDCFNGVRVHDIRASDFHDAEGDDVARVCTHWAYRDDIWPRTGLAAPAAAAAPAGGYKLRDWGKPEYLDGAMARYSIEDARGNTIATIDDLPGDKAIADKLLAALNAPTAAPAAPAVDAPKELDPGLSREVYRACEDLPEGWSIRIDLENGYGSVTLIDPDGEENELPVDGWLSDAMRASIAAAQAKEGGVAA